MKTLHKKFIGITAAILFAVSGNAAYAQTSAPAEAQLSLVNQIVAIIVANPEYRSFIPTVMSLLENIASDIDDNANELPTGNDVVYDPANIEDIDFDIDDDELVVTLSGSDGGCSRVQEPSVERNGDKFEITLLETNPANPAVVLCTADIRFFEKEVVIDLDDLDEDTYTILVNDEEEFEFEIKKSSESDKSNKGVYLVDEENSERVETYTIAITADDEGEDVLIPAGVEEEGSEDATTGFVYVLEYGTVASATIDNDDDLDEEVIGGVTYYRVDAGETEEFEVRFNFAADAAAEDDGNVTIEAIQYTAKNGNTVFPVQVLDKNVNYSAN